MKPRPTRINVVPGRVGVEGATLFARSQSMALLTIDLRTKHAEAKGDMERDGHPAITIGTQLRGTLYLAPGVERGLYTDIALLDFGPEWRVFACEVSRYSCCVALWRRR
jgi:hypothetical protein